MRMSRPDRAVSSGLAQCGVAAQVSFVILLTAREGHPMAKVSLQQISGVCAILTVTVVIVGFALFASTDVSDTAPTVEVLPAVDDDRAIVATATWLIIFATILLLGTVPGLFRVLHHAGEIMWIAVLASVIGGVFLTLSTVIELAVIYELAPAYVEASPDARADLLVLGDTLFSITQWSRALGDTIFTGIGRLLFSLAILHTGFAPKWIGWLGLIGAVGHWFALLAPASEVFELVWFVGEIAFFLWLIALGVVLLRKSELPAATA